MKLEVADFNSFLFFLLSISANENRISLKGVISGFLALATPIVFTSFK
jgi:hypothetical protein